MWSPGHIDEKNDYFNITLEEFTRLFKRKNNCNTFLASVTETLFDQIDDEFKRLLVTRTRGSKSSQEKTQALDQQVSVLINLMEMRQNLLKRLVESMVERFQESQAEMSDLIDSDLTQMLRAANRCVKQSATDLQEIVIILKQESTFMTKTDLQQNTENALQGLKEEQTKCFM